MPTPEGGFSHGALSKSPADRAPHLDEGTITMTSQNFSSAPAGGSAPVPKTKWIVQLVVSFLCGGNIITVILAILGLVKADTDLEAANKYYKWGWIVFAIVWVLMILLWVLLALTGALTATVETY
jgi:hypothetical protein